jgi:transcriptional regulator with PAS, ATPase and Fis domain
MRELYALAERVAAGDLSVLLLGETGVGKDLLASHIHACSARRRGPFLRVNCAAMPDTLLESELFGHERGAFSGAHLAKTGLLEAADGGTVLLDEIAEMTVGVQSKLLRALEDGEIMRLGSVRATPIDVRFIGATSRDIDELVRAGSFRADLYYRIGGAVLRAPPLRARTEEILPLAETFLADACRRANRPALELSKGARDVLRGHSWPGNVRELRNAMDRAALVARGPMVEVAELRFTVPAHTPAPIPTPAGPNPWPPTAPALPPGAETETVIRPLSADVDDLERRRIMEALERFGGNQTRAARALGVSRRTLLSRLDAYGVPRPRK